MEQGPHRPFRLLYVGNWSHRKGADLLASIMQALGDGFTLHYTAGRRVRANRFIVPPNSRNLGYPHSATALADVYRNSDALLFPSRLEGFGLVALEAQACGLPVIATRCSSLPEVVEDGVTGILCPRDDIGAFANAARRLATEPDDWRRMGLAARERVERLFSLDAMIDQYLDVYRACLASVRKPA